MLVKILSTILLLAAVYMGLKQGYALFSGKPEMVELFGKWNFSKTAVMINGLITIISALLLLHPKTFVIGNFIMAAGILLITCYHLSDKNLKGAAIEIPFLLVNLLLIYLEHPLKK